MSASDQRDAAGRRPDRCLCRRHARAAGDADPGAALDDATLERSARVHREQLEFVEIYAGYIARWRGEVPSADQLRELDRIDGQTQQLRQVTLAVLVLVAELRAGTIDRVMTMSGEDLGLRALLGAG